MSSDPYGATPSPGPPSRSDSEHTLSHRISNLSDIRDYETYEGYQLDQPGVQSPPLLRGRESLVSLQSAYDVVQAPAAVAQSPSAYDDGSRSNSNSRSSSWSNPFANYTGGGGGYEPVPLSGAPSPQRSRTFSRRVSLRKTHATIVEEPETIRESIDLATLVSHAAPPAGSAEAYAHVSRYDTEDDAIPFDMTGYLGPATSQDDAFMKRLQEQEASGRLTGGLGIGLSVDTTMTESALLAASPIDGPRGLNRGFSRRVSRRGPQPLGRQGTVRALAQSEANRRGEVVEVIMEEPDAMASEVDLSVMAGTTSVDPDQGGIRRTTMPTAAKQSYVAYPQPDWKPFSMRWPYLLFLIVLSLAFGGIQEVIYQISTQKHLLEFRTPGEIPGFWYLAFKFAPTFISVTFGVLWQITDFEVRRLEAFYQLSKERGALADESINVDYFSNFSFFRPFRALYCKHYAVAVSSVATLLAVSLVPTLGTAAIVLNPDRSTREADPLGVKFITINPVWSRFLTVILFIIAALGCVLFWQLQRRRSGLLADVKGIAGLASMAVVSHVMMDFKDMDVATHKDIHAKLKDHRYVLRNSSLAPDDEIPVLSEEVERYKENHLSQNPHPLMLRARGSIPFIVGIALFSAMIPIFLFTDANRLTDRAPWVVTALAVCIKLSWGALETSVRMMEPYYLLSRRHAAPSTLALDYTAMPFAWVAVQAARHRHWLVFSVGFGTVLTELLTVLVTSLATVQGRAFVSAIEDGDGAPAAGNATTAPPPPRVDDGHEINAGQETEVSFWISLGFISVILLYMGVLATVVFLRRRRAFLPRQPNTIASVLAFIHQSKMLYDFVGTSKMTSVEMVKLLDGLGKTYGLGWFEGRDGQTHCGVDQEELMSNYKLGYDYSRSNKPWMERPVEWL